MLLPHRLHHLLTIPLMPLPLWQPIRHIDRPPLIENMAARMEPPLLRRAPKLDQRREQQQHVAPLIHDWRAAVLARHLTRQDVVLRFGPRVPVDQLRGAGREADVGFVEYCSLEMRGVVCVSIPSVPLSLYSLW